MAISPPRPKSPPLNALRAFEAAARLGGFSAAAEELSVTPGAIAQHIKSLEAWAGAALFVRQAQGVELTPLGDAVIGGFSDAFDRLGEAVLTLRAHAAPREVRIAALPSIAQLWLSPRLPLIRRAVGEARISVTALETPPNAKRAPFDLSIFYETRVSGGLVTLQDPDVIFPVCAPDLAKRLREPGDLLDAVLLFDSAWPDDWSDWFRAAGVKPSSRIEGAVFSLYSLAVDEARNGAGVLMGHAALVERDLASGALIQPFQQSVKRAHKLCIRMARRFPNDAPAARVARALATAGNA